MKRVFFIISLVLLTELLNAQLARTSWSFGFGFAYPRFHSTDVRPKDDNYGAYFSFQRNFSENVALRFLGGGYIMHGRVPGGIYNYTDGSVVPGNKESMYSMVLHGSFDLLIYIAPCSPVSPYLSFGLGAAYYDAGWKKYIINPAADDNRTAQLNFGMGSEWSLSQIWKIKTELAFHTIESQVDGIINNNRQGFLGSNADMYFTFDLGLNYYFSFGEPSRYCDMYDGITSEYINIRPATREDVEEIVKANIPREVVKEVVVEKPVEVKEGMIPLESGQGWRLNGIHFETGSARIIAESYPVLYNAYLFLDENPSLNIEINGHTDNIGSDIFNQKLSEARSRAVKDYLVKRGIKPQRLKIAGLGETMPLADNDTAEGRALNRRIEFRIIK